MTKLNKENSLKARWHFIIAVANVWLSVFWKIMLQRVLLTHIFPAIVATSLQCINSREIGFCMHGRARLTCAEIKPSSVVHHVRLIIISMTTGRNSKDNHSRRKFHSTAFMRWKFFRRTKGVSQHFVGPFFSQQTNGSEEGNLFLQGYS